MNGLLMACYAKRSFLERGEHCSLSILSIGEVQQANQRKGVIFRAVVVRKRFTIVVAPELTEQNGSKPTAPCKDVRLQVDLIFTVERSVVEGKRKIKVKLRLTFSHKD